MYVLGGVHEQPPRSLLRPSEARVQQTLPEWHRQAWKGCNTSLLTSKWNGDRRKDVTVATKTHTHTPASNSSPHSFQGHLSSKTVEKVTWISYNEIREVKKKKKKESLLKLLGVIFLHYLNGFLCSKLKKRASSSLRGTPYCWLSKTIQTPLCFDLCRWQGDCYWLIGCEQWCWDHPHLTDDVIEAQRW